MPFLDNQSSSVTFYSYLAKDAIENKLHCRKFKQGRRYTDRHKIQNEIEIHKSRLEHVSKPTIISEFPENPAHLKGPKVKLM